MSKRLSLFLLLLLVASFALAYLLKTGKSSAPQRGEQAPQFVARDRRGQEIALQSFRGQVVLLHFWATWCGPCQEEIPSLEALYQKYRTKGFVVLGVSLDEAGASGAFPNEIEDFLERFSIHFPVVLDADQAISDSYRVSRIPESYLLDAKGVIVDKIVGPQDYMQPVFAQKIERLFKP